MPNVAKAVPRRLKRSCKTRTPRGNKRAKRNRAGICLKIAKRSKKAVESVLQTAAFAALQCGFDRSKRVALGGQPAGDPRLGLDPGLDKIIAKRLHPSHGHAGAYRKTVCVLLTGFDKLDMPARVTRRVHVGDVLAGDVDAELVGVKGTATDLVG